ncbi:MAG TPA: GNAT family N-acetyltransferase [Actinomycetes bacterium]|nr:GNAT family N-acetyltransferase [Actinomycetes bacterium]
MEIVVGAASLNALREEFLDWSRSRRLPTTGTSSWLFPAIGADPQAKPWAAVARDAFGQLEAFVVLIDQEMDSQTVTCLAGTEQGNRGVLLVDTPELAEDLGRAVGQALGDRQVSHPVLLGPLSADDPRVHAFASALPRAQLIEADPIPVIRQVSPDARSYFSPGMRRTLRKARNRLTKDGRHTVIRYTRDAHEVSALIPQLEQCHRERDHAHGRASDLDDTRARLMWRHRIQELAADGHLELATMQIDEQFAAHALAAPDQPCYRVIEGRFVTEWARYAPGRLLEAAILQRVLDDEGFDSLDWMTAVAPEKLIATNDADRMLIVHVGPGRGVAR